MKHYAALTKPRITWLILMSTGVGYYFGLAGNFSWLTLLHTMVGTALIASGTAALNQWYERDADALMKRTAGRPLPSGLLAEKPAFRFGIALLGIGLAELGTGVNWLTAGLGLFTILTYLGLYTPLKRRSPVSTTIGAVPGAMPPLIGYAAAHGSLTAEAWVLYAILFLWQFPHFYAIAWMYRDEYRNAGIRMLPVVQPDGDSTVRRMLIFSVLLAAVSVLPNTLGMAGAWYLGGAVLAGAYYFYACLRMRTERTRERARGVLLASVVYLPVLYGLLLLDRPPL